MDRRAFLAGLFGTAAIASLPAIPTIPPAYTVAQWEAAMVELYSHAFSDLVVYGTYILRGKEDFPFVELVPFSEWTSLPSDTGRGGLFG